MDGESIVSLIAQLGVAGIFLWLYIQERSTTKELTAKLLDAYMDNTRILTEIRASQDKMAVTIISLTDRITAWLISGQRGCGEDCETDERYKPNR